MRSIVIALLFVAVANAISCGPLINSKSNRIAVQQQCSECPPIDILAGGSSSLDSYIFSEGIPWNLATGNCNSDSDWYILDGSEWVHYNDFYDPLHGGDVYASPVGGQCRGSSRFSKCSSAQTIACECIRIDIGLGSSSNDDYVIARRVNSVSCSTGVVSSPCTGLPTSAGTSPVTSSAATSSAGTTAAATSGAATTAATTSAATTAATTAAVTSAAVTSSSGSCINPTQCFAGRTQVTLGYRVEFFGGNNVASYGTMSVSDGIKVRQGSSVLVRSGPCPNPSKLQFPNGGSLQCPSGALSTLPFCEVDFTPDNANSNHVNVPNNGFLVLPAGTYGNVVVGDRATLRINGDYRVLSFTAGYDSNVEVTGASARIQATNTIRLNDRADVDGFIILATNSVSNSAISLGYDVNNNHGSIIDAALVAPNGRIFVQRTHVRGIIQGGSIEMGADSDFTCSGFA